MKIDEHLDNLAQSKKIFADMKLNETFDRAAQIYEDARPTYPDEVIDWIIKKTNITQDEKLLEIGAGTGQATMKFAQRGHAIHCVEYGKNLAEILMKKCGEMDVTVDISSFEEWKPKHSFETSFIYSATAFHWIDPEIGYKKCYDLLKDNGYLVLLWNFPQNIEVGLIKKAYDLLSENYPDFPNMLGDTGKFKIDKGLEILKNDLFLLDDYLDYKWKHIQTKEDFTKGIYSQSYYIALDKEKQKVISNQIEELFKELPDIIETGLSTIVYIAKKRSGQ